MEKALKGVPPTDFPKAEFGGEEEEEMVTVTVCTESQLLATPNCPHTETRTYRRGEQPTDYCTIHAEGERVAVPSVTGMEEAEARAALQAAGLVPSVTYSYSSVYSQGVVMGQAPQAGTMVSPGSTVVINVSKGPLSQTPIPNVVGMAETAAKDALSAAGFNYKVVYQPTLKPEEVGLVIRQFPVGGASASPGSQVIITVGKKSDI